MKRSAAALIPALLGSADPSIRWKTHVHVLGEEPDSKSIRLLREEIRSSPTVRALLSRRDQLGRPGTRRQVYYKWQGLHWVLASLADLGYPEGDESPRTDGSSRATSSRCITRVTGTTTSLAA